MQAAKVSRVDRDIPKSSSSHPQVYLKSSQSHLIQSDPIWSNLIQSDLIWSNFKGFISFLLSNIKFPWIYSKFRTKILSVTNWIVGPIRRASQSKNLIVGSNGGTISSTQNVHFRLIIWVLKIVGQDYSLLRADSTYVVALNGLQK